MQVSVDQKFVNSVRVMLIRLAQTENRPPSERSKAIERSRQYCEGYLGIKREVLASENSSTVDDVLEMCGFDTHDPTQFSLPK